MKNAKTIVIMIIILLVLIVILQNTKAVETKILFFTIIMPRVLGMMLSVFGLTAAYPLGVLLALGRQSKMPAIKSLQRVSKPGLRKYVDKDHLPRVLNGLGVAIISTSQGVVTDKEARSLNIGGEVLCYVY